MVATILSPNAGFGCDGLADGPTGTVTAVHDGNTIELDSGIVVRLAGTHAPMPAGARPGAAAEPLAEAARAALSAMLMGKTVALGLDAEETDRYGRMRAEVFIGDVSGIWVEAALAEQGLARVEVLPGSTACTADLLAAEALARANGLGIWADPYYSVHDAADPAALAAAVGRYVLIEGAIVGTGETRNRVYLDFGRVWKDDVTATIEGKARALFAAANIDPLALKGKRVRIRGWLQSRDGPLIELGSPAQIEVLGLQ